MKKTAAVKVSVISRKKKGKFPSWPNTQIVRVVYSDGASVYVRWNWNFQTFEWVACDDNDAYLENSPYDIRDSVWETLSFSEYLGAGSVPTALKYIRDMPNLMAALGKIFKA